MNENVENLILVQTREMRTEMAAMRADMAEMKIDLAHVDQKVDGLSLGLTMLMGHVAHFGARVETMEESRK